MPDVKAPQCEYSPAGSPAGCSMDLSGDLSVLSSPLSAFPHHAVPPFPAQDVALGRYPSSYDNNNGLLSNLGLYCSTSSMYPLKQPDARSGYGTMRFPQGCVNAGGTRLYRSLENLHWAAISDAGAYPYRSVDNELIFHCTSSSQWYDGPPQGPQIYSVLPSPESLALYSRRGVVRKDIPLFPQWLLPAVEDWSVNTNARKGLRDKLRLQSTRVTEPHKPLRPVLGNAPSQMYPCDQDVQFRAGPLSSQRGREQELSARRITSPEEIKQEAMRRLQLRRQRSTPNLALSSRQESSSISKALTSDPICTNSAHSTPERKRPPVGRLHIPTFEEFKRMRQKEGGRIHNPSSTQSSRDVKSNDKHKEVNGGEGEQIGETQHDKNTDFNRQMSDPSSTVEVPGGPICTGPVARSPLHPQAPTEKGEVNKGPTGRGATDVAVVPFPVRRESGDGPSSCCPAILLEGTDLSSYGAKIYKIKDGFLGSALDLIKKR